MRRSGTEGAAAHFHGLERLTVMPLPYVIAKLRGSEDVSGVVLPNNADAARRGAELLTLLNATVIDERDVELVPYFQPERQRLNLAPDQPDHLPEA